MARTPDGYYSINNANSGLPAEIFNASLSDGGSVDQWASNGGYPAILVCRSPPANGYYYIRNGNSNSYLTSNTSNAFQQGITGNLLQQWQFVLANPAPSGTLKAQYKFEGNANDSTGANNATAVGSPTYSIGPTAAEGQRDQPERHESVRAASQRRGQQQGHHRLHLGEMERRQCLSTHLRFWQQHHFVHVPDPQLRRWHDAFCIIAGAIDELRPCRLSRGFRYTELAAYHRRRAAQSAVASSHCPRPRFGDRKPQM